jgi:hypothetical protein
MWLQQSKSKTIKNKLIFNTYYFSMMRVRRDYKIMNEYLKGLM